MNIQQIEIWLLNTVPGIIILGAVGSILGSIFLWIAVRGIKALAAFIINKTNEVVWNFIFSAVATYTRAYLRARELVKLVSAKEDILPVSLLYSRTLRKQFFYSVTALIAFFISLLLFIFVGTEYTKTSVFFIAITFMSFHDSLIYDFYLKMIENKYLSEGEGEVDRMHLNKDDVLKDADVLIENWLDKKKHNPQVDKSAP